MKLKFPQLTEQNFKDAFELIRKHIKSCAVASYETQFGLLIIGTEMQDIAISPSLTKSGKLDVRYQLSSDSKKLLKTIVKDIPDLDKEHRKDMVIALRALIIKCVALDTPASRTAKPSFRTGKLTFSLGK